MQYNPSHAESHASFHIAAGIQKYPSTQLDPPHNPGAHTQAILTNAHWRWLPKGDTTARLAAQVIMKLPVRAVRQLSRAPWAHHVNDNMVHWPVKKPGGDIPEL